MSLESKTVIDSSVWIDYLQDRSQGKPSSSLHSRLASILDSDYAAITDVIRTEILVGAASSAEFDKLDDLFSSVECLSLLKEDQRSFNNFCHMIKRKGLLGKYTDMSIAFLAKKHGYEVLSADKYFATLRSKKII